MSQQGILATTSLEFAPPIPCNLLEVLTGQVERYMEMRAFDAIGCGEVEYRNELTDLVQAFIEEKRWDQELAKAGLLDVALFDPRPSADFFVEVSGTDCYIIPDQCPNYEGIVTPARPYLTHVQLGPKYQNVAPCDVRSQLATSWLEQCFVVKEGLTIVALRGYEFLRTCYMDLSGSISMLDGVPCLVLDGGGPCLSGGGLGSAASNCGSASRGKVPSALRLQITSTT